MSPGHKHLSRGVVREDSVDRQFKYVRPGCTNIIPVCLTTCTLSSVVSSVVE